MQSIRKKTEKGITLIALVVTVVVLLILAGITINLVLGDNGILSRAQNAKDETQKSNEKEGILFAVTGLKITDQPNAKIKAEELQKELDNQFGSGATTVDDNLDESFKITIKNSGRIYTLYDYVKITEGDYERWDGTASSEPTEKTSDEIHIYTVAELKWLEDQVNNQENLFEGYTIYLEDNLDLGARGQDGEWETEANEKVKWTAIGKTSEKTLKAVFEGNNHTIKGVYINDETEFNGIFGNSNTIQNLTIKNSYIKGASYTGGIVAALRQGKIENCHNINTTIVGTSGSMGFGGIVGQTNGDVINCDNKGKITVEGKQVGGIVGYAMGEIQNCENYGKVEAGDIEGGIAGYSKNGNIDNCKNYGEVIAKRAKDGSGANCAGIVSKTSESDISDCMNFGNITVEFTEKYSETERGWSTAAGIKAFGSGDVINCTNSGNISVTSPNWWNVAGGIIGQITGNTEKVPQIKGCSNSGKISANGLNSSYFVLPGGIIGDGWSKYELTECYNSGDVEGRNGSYIYEGGIIGRIQNTTDGVKIEKCFSNGSVKGYDAKGLIRAGGIAGDVTKNNVNQVKQAYYYDKDNSIAGGLINADYPENEVKKIENNFASLEEFLTWVEQQ